MDPDATLTALLDAFRNGDKEAAWDAIEALSDWIVSKDGFLPKDPRGLIFNDAELTIINVAMTNMAQNINQEKSLTPDMMVFAIDLGKIGLRVARHLERGRDTPKT